LQKPGREMLIQTLLNLLVIFTVVVSLATAEDAAAPPALTPSAAQTSAEVGRPFTVSCSLPSAGCAANYTASSLQWLSPGGSPVGLNGRISSVNGSLVCANASLSDTGNYNCSLAACGLSATAYVLVYEMPSYAAMLAVIYSIDGGLAVAVAVLCTLSLVLTRHSAANAIV
ncbi:hypothetical protein BOX15_Mlig032533g1, partial [Macrostomum lignano]